MTDAQSETGLNAVSEDAWRDVISAMDRTYSELVDYQEQLERQKRELDEMRQFMASVLASMSDLLIVIDRDGVIERTGGATAAIFGADTPVEAGMALADLLAPEEFTRLNQTIGDVALSRAPVFVEISFEATDGPTPLELSVSPRLDGRGRAQGFVLIGRPLGELRSAYSELEASHAALKDAQTQLVRNEKLASLGRLVAGVAHELNNPISFVYANTHALEKYAVRFETYFKAVQAGQSRPELIALRDELRLERTVKNLRSAVDGAKDGAERVRDIVADLRRLSADGSSEDVSFDLVTTTRTAADWVARGSRAAVDIRIEAGAARPARGNPGHVQQIVMNLVQNAIDALEGTEQPCITLKVFETDETVVLHVIDNGPGIPPELAQSIFDPFFTTKQVGQGTGLGLSISHKIAEEHGGSLTLLSSGSEGCVFALSLPAEGTQ